MATIANLPRISASRLSSLIIAESAAANPTLAVIDVRDDDHIGGHIINSINVPSSTLDYKMPELVRKLKEKEVVVFHCALSQQRGPSAALKYLRERERLVGALNKPITGGEMSTQKGEEGDKVQRVYVLDRGFVGWQEVYGEDENMTEGFRKELWKDGYWM